VLARVGFGYAVITASERAITGSRRTEGPPSWPQPCSTAKLRSRQLRSCTTTRVAPCVRARRCAARSACIVFGCMEAAWSSSGMRTVHTPRRPGTTCTLRSAAEWDSVAGMAPSCHARGHTSSCANRSSCPWFTALADPWLSTARHRQTPLPRPPARATVCRQGNVKVNAATQTRGARRSDAGLPVPRRVGCPKSPDSGPLSPHAGTGTDATFTRQRQSSELNGE
jgi:hypothetical protein